jgi:hypothetical protein
VQNKSDSESWKEPLRPSSSSCSYNLYQFKDHKAS